jgi:hypothetical protein
MLRSMAGDTYAERKRAAERAVERWEYMTHPGRQLEPGYFERNSKFTRGRKLKALPATRKPNWGVTAYGLDANGRIVLERTATGYGGWTETFYVWGDGVVERAYYETKDGKPVITRAGLDAAGRVVTWELDSPLFGAWNKTFAYPDDGTIVIEEEYVDQNGLDYPKQTITVTPQTGPDPKVEDHLPAVEAHLIAEIPRVIKAAKLRDRAYTLIVSFAGTGNDMFPPILAIGTERERAEWIARKGPLAVVLWQESDFEQFANAKLDLRTKAFAQLADPLNTAIARRDAYTKGYAAYARIARALRKLDWSKILPVTDDFVVFAVDHDDTGLAKALKEAAGAKRYAAWKKARWVP